MRALFCFSLVLLVVRALPLERKPDQLAAVGEKPLASSATLRTAPATAESPPHAVKASAEKLPVPTIRDTKPQNNQNKQNNHNHKKNDNQQKSPPKHSDGGGGGGGGGADSQPAVLIDKSHEAPWYHYSFHEPDGYHFKNGYNYHPGYHYRDGYQYRRGPHPGNGYQYREGFHFNNGNYYTYS